MYGRDIKMLYIDGVGEGSLNWQDPSTLFTLLILTSLQRGLRLWVQFT